MGIVTVVTHDGEVFTGNDWEAILTQFRAMNFSEPKDLAALMANLSHRIEVASGQTFPGEGVSIGTYADYGYELERVGFLRILEEKHDNTG
jgi:hypothetical protein